MHDTIPSAAPHLIPEKEVRRRFGISRSTMWRWRSSGTGPKCYQLGPRFMYAEADLVAWLEAHRPSASRVA